MELAEKTRIFQASIKKAFGDKHSTLVLPKGNNEFHVILSNLFSENGYYAVIFSHEFAKKFFGEGLASETLLSRSNNPQWSKQKVPLQLVWQYHLSELVMYDEPLEYIAKFLKEEKQTQALEKGKTDETPTDGENKTA
jgi:hypothetical protein